MKAKILVGILLFCSSQAIRADRETPGVQGKFNSLRLEVVNESGAQVSSFHIEIASQNGIAAQDIYDARGPVDIKMETSGTLFLTAARFRPEILYVPTLPRVAHVVLRSSPTIHVRVRDGATQKSIKGVGHSDTALLLEATSDGFNLTSFPERQFALMINAPGYIPLVVGMPGTVTADKTVDVTLRLADKESLANGYDAFGVGVILGPSPSPKVKGTIAGSAAATRFLPGDEIRNIDGTPIGKGTLPSVLRDMLFGLDGAPAKVVVRRGDETVEIELVRSRYYDTADIFPDPEYGIRKVPGVLANPQTQSDAAL